jgi:hypothetical protein
MTGRPLSECRELELSLGVLVLGALEPAERPAVEAHLAQCPRCTAILAELAPLPGLLHRLDPIEHQMPAAPPPSSPPPYPRLGSPALRDRLVDAARGERARSRRRRWVAGISAAAVLVGVLLSVAVSGGLWGHGQANRVTVASATDPRSAVRADVRLVPDNTGTQLALQLTGVAPGEHCRLVAVDARGRQQVAATWVATYEGRAAVTGHTSLQPHEITRLLVVTDAGRQLVQLPIHG